ncbi:ADP-ribose pyrophosphatase, partial [Klebsiella pneumoniae]|nr:ADP-ribose pyrophosphatase [Klebsiella pneumoniae]
MDLTEKTLNKQTIYKGKIIEVDVDEVQLPNGKTSKREIVNHTGAVAVCALTNENKVVFVKQYRKPIEQ